MNDIIYITPTIPKRTFVYNILMMLKEKSGIEEAENAGFSLPVEEIASFLL